MKKTLLTVVAVVVTLALFAGVGASIYYSVSSYNSITAYVKEMHDKEIPEETRENDVKIAESYKIMSTEDISDAYKSGDTSKLNDKQKETLDMAKKVVDEVIKDGMSDFEKEVAIYDWMCKNLAHDENLLVVIPTGSGEPDTPYGVLKFHNAVCVGYATTFRLFMQMMDIECMVVHNTECYHSWDLVKIDGDWYHTDIYADVGRGNYTHFNLPDSMRRTQANWDTSYFPAATSLKYNKSMENMVKVANVFELPTALSQIVLSDTHSAFIKIDGEVNEDIAHKAVAITNIFAEALNGVYIPNVNIWLDGAQWYPDDLNGGFLFSVSFYFYQENEASESLTDEERTEMNDIIYEIINQIQEQLSGNNTENME
ncbi:MAG: transglutaminase domain-containing protein [Lachnospiraceae bacterium]|nr:transglutaminase domain-containing protein [Lachnospiraceae bacterium]